MLYRKIFFLLVGVGTAFTFIVCYSETAKKAFRKVHTYHFQVRSSQNENGTSTKPKVNAVSSQATTTPIAPVETTTAFQEKLTMLIMYPQYGGITLDHLPPRCPNCDVTVDKKRINDKNTKALIFHFNDPIYSIAPKKRRTDQFYVWNAGEGPVALYYFRNLKLKEYDGFFNLTMTYKLDSDVWSPYGTNFWLLRERKDLPLNDSSFEDLLRKKTRMALWVVSNCGLLQGSRDRMQYAKALAANGLDVDFRGGCFGKTGKFENYKYKFYLSFENQWPCKDYITEKFWNNALKHGTVPVVLGPPKKEYEFVAPAKKSFIHANDFSGPKELAEYLNYLDKNDTAYKEYLAWMKTDLRVRQRERETSFCGLCKIMHESVKDNATKPRVVPSLYNWYYGEDYQKCLNVPNLGVDTP